MVATTLTDQLISSGKSLVEALDASSIPIDGALWFYFPEEGFWKLILSFKNIEKDGPKSSYQKVQKALSKLKDRDVLSLDDVSISKPRSPILHLLKMTVRTGPGISGIRFSNNVINGQVISDAYIYRLV